MKIAVVSTDSLTKLRPGLLTAYALRISGVEVDMIDPGDAVLFRSAIRKLRRTSCGYYFGPKAQNKLKQPYDMVIDARVSKKAFPEFDNYIINQKLEMKNLEDLDSLGFLGSSDFRVYHKLALQELENARSIYYTKGE